MVGQGTSLGAKPTASQTISEVDEDSWTWGEESWEESEEIGELNEEEIALVENWEDEKLTKIIMRSPAVWRRPEDLELSSALYAVVPT